MTPTEVKDAHDRIWAVREKIGLIEHIGITFPFHNYYTLNIFYMGFDKEYHDKRFTTTDQVNQFLKEIEV